MGILLSMLKNENLQMGLVYPIKTVDAKATFALVKEMLHQSTSGSDSESLDSGVVRRLLGKAPSLGSNISGGKYRV